MRGQGNKLGMLISVLLGLFVLETALASGPVCTAIFGVATAEDVVTLLDDSISYAVTHRIQNNTVYLQFKADHNGWLGFGLAEQTSGHMKGADLVAVQVTADGKARVQDMYAPFAPSSYGESSAFVVGLAAYADLHNDWILHNGYRTDDGLMTVEISRALSTNDTQDRAIEAGLRRIVWAWGTDNTVGYHGGNRGTGTIQFIPSIEQRQSEVSRRALAAENQDQEHLRHRQGHGHDQDTQTPHLRAGGRVPPTPASSSQKQDAGHNPTLMRHLSRAYTASSTSSIPEHDGAPELYRMKNYTIPSARTTYACQSLRLPTDVKRHVIAIQPVIQEATRAFVHHAIVHICVGNSTFFRDHVTPQKCGGEDEEGEGSSPIGNPDAGCSGLMYSWAVGHSDWILPIEAGLPVGPNATDIQQIILEVHYDNPDMESGHVDSSGFRAFYTDTLREHDMGGVTLGDPLVTQSDLPGSSSQVHREMTCPSACTQSFSQAVTVVSEFPHAHYYGQKIYTELYDSQGNLKRVTSRVDFWDNGFQQSIQGDTLQTYQIQPGDSLQTHCVYNTAQQRNHVLFGTETRDEMCMVFLFFYPAQFRGVDAEGRQVPFAYCGLFDEENQMSACGGLTQIPDSDAVLPSTQIVRGNISLEDPLHFGEATMSGPGRVGEIDACMPAPTTTPTPTPSTSPSLTPSTSPSQPASASPSSSSSAPAPPASSPSSSSSPSPATSADPDTLPSGSAAPVLTSTSPTATALANPCSATPCKNGAVCSHNATLDTSGGAEFECACPEGTFTGQLCELPVVSGPCAGSSGGICGSGVCSDSRATARGFACHCNAGWLKDLGTGACSVEVAVDASPSCSDGTINGRETGLDCGYVAADVEGGSCRLCGSGFGCDSTSNCDDQLVCSSSSQTCVPAVRLAGSYIEVKALRITGVTPAQFMNVLAEAYLAKVVERTGAAGAFIVAVREIPAAASASSGRRSQAGTAVGVEVDTQIRFEATADEVAFRATVLAYMEGTPVAGGNGLLDDLRAAAPGLASRITVDTSGASSEIEVLASDEEVDTTDTTPTGDDEDDGGSSIGVIAGAAVGGLVGLGLIAVAVYFLCWTRTDRAATIATAGKVPASDTPTRQDNPMKASPTAT